LKNQGLENRLQLWRTKKYPKNELDLSTLSLELAIQYTNIALKEYERTGYPHGSIVDNFFGIIGELCVKECLIQEGFDNFEYIDRKIDYWKGDPRPYDFKVNGKTLEIVTVKPFHKYCIIKETTWKKSDFSICVQINNLEYSVQIYHKDKYRWYKINDSYPTEITDFSLIKHKSSFDKVGHATVIGYGTLEEIQNLKNGWQYGEPPKKPTTQYAGRYIKLDRMRDINKLWDLLKKA